MSSAKYLSRQQLEHAFHLFNQVSEQLTDSYKQLQQRIGELNLELAAARSERMRQLAEKERYAHRFAQLLDALPAAVVVLGEGGRVEQFNPTACHLFGDTLQIGATWSEISRRSVASYPRRDELKLVSGALVSFSEQPLAAEAGHILLFLDITETRDLQLSAERQQRLSAMGQLAAQLAHQIRTPLSSALIYTAHLSRPDLTEIQREKFSDRSRQTLLQMEQQINDMLTFARGGQYQMCPVDLKMLLQLMVQTLEPIVQQHDIQLHQSVATAGSALVTGNQDALLGALMNIALNARQHSVAGDTITIELNDAPDVWQVVISDQGPGVPEEILEKIFDPFFTTRNQGTGLGLAVCQAVALEHGGKISVDRPVTGGARFCLSLPKATPQSAQPASATLRPWQSHSESMIGSAA